jgi:hypothetical protein
VINRTHPIVDQEWNLRQKYPQIASGGLKVSMKML